jgi:hypothetical protein
MSLTDRAVLVIDRGKDAGPLQFHLNGPQQTGALNKKMLVGNRGQLLAELADHVPVDLGGLAGSNAAGLSIDAGQGEDLFELSFELTPRPDASPAFQWGDGSRSPGDPITQRDMTGSGEVRAQLQMLRYHCRQARIDSRSPARLHWGEWTNGFIDGGSLTGISQGVFGTPIPVTVLEVVPRDDRDDTAIQVSLLCQRVKEFPGVDFSEGFDELADELGDQFDGIADGVTDFVSDI